MRWPRRSRPSHPRPRPPLHRAGWGSLRHFVYLRRCADRRYRPLPPDGRPYNLGVSFASAKTGQPLANVQVRLRRHGRVLVEFNASGSRCLFSVPDASYRVEGTYQGATQFAIVETGALTTQLKW